jgi:zinc protease
MLSSLPQFLRTGAALILIFFMLPVVAIELPPGVTQASSVEGVTEYRLDNGLRVLLSPDNSKPTVTVNMTYLVGARHENYGQTGMAHLLEHLLFRGTPSMRNALAEFSKRGLAANGSTSNDRTNYYASFAASPETLEWYLRWQADAMVNSLIAQEDLDSEMTVVRNEMERGENNPFQVLMQKMQAAAFQWHSYGKSTIGARSDVENVDIRQLRHFYETYYQPDNAVLIVTGQFDPAGTLAVINDAFKTIPKPARTLPPEYTVEPVQDGERLVTLRRHGGSPLVAALFHIPAAASSDFVALDMATSILGDTPSGRLYHGLVRKNLASGVFGFAASMREPGYAFFGAELEAGMDQAQSLATLNDTLDSLAAEPFTQTELDRIRSRWLTGWTQTYADSAGLASALSDAVSDGDWRLFFLQRDRVKALELQEVQRAATTWLVKSNRTNGQYIPTESPVRAPQAAPIDVQSLLKDYEGQDRGEPVEAFDPTPANIDARTERDPLALPNGSVKLALLPKATRGERVEANLLIQFGTAESLKGKRAAASAVISLLDHGTKDMSRQEIEDEYTKLEAEVSFGGGPSGVVVDMSTTREHLPALIELVLHVLREATFPADELLEYKTQASTAIRNAMSEPSAVASRALSRHENPWPRDDVRYTPTFVEAQEEIASLKQEDLAAFHSQFYGAGTVTFAAVGAFDSGAAKAALKQGLDGWQKAPDYVRLSDPYHAVTPKDFAIDTPDKANAFFLAALPLEVQDTDPEYPALYIANYMLGASETSRLWTRVRVQEGLSYSVGSRLQVSAYEPSAQWSIYAINAPENAKRLKGVVDEELNKARAEGFTEEEVSEAVNALLNYRRLARSSDEILTSTWINYLQQERSFEWSQKMDEAFKALTADKVNAVLRKRLQPGQFSTAIAADARKLNEQPRPVSMQP